jgi:hypothetical protein
MYAQLRTAPRPRRQEPAPRHRVAGADRVGLLDVDHVILAGVVATDVAVDLLALLWIFASPFVVSGSFACSLDLPPGRRDSRTTPTLVSLVNDHYRVDRKRSLRRTRSSDAICDPQ